MFLRMICTDGSLLHGAGDLKLGECYRVGRSSNCSFVVNDLSVSRLHAEVIPGDQGVVVKDLDSSNGTYVDGVRVAEAVAAPGQFVRFGNAQFRLVWHEHAVDGAQDNSDLSTILVPQSAASVAMESLSEGQKRVLELLLTGMSEKAAARTLDISPHTVHNHVKEIYKRMHVNSRPELLALFVVHSKKE